MKEYLVRRTQQHSMLIEAKNAQEAVEKAQELPKDFWNFDWSEVDAEEE